MYTADTLIGVDLSDRMIEVASGKGESGRLKTAKTHHMRPLRAGFASPTPLACGVRVAQKACLFFSLRSTRGDGCFVVFRNYHQHVAAADIDEESDFSPLLFTLAPHRSLLCEQLLFSDGL